MTLEVFVKKIFYNQKKPEYFATWFGWMEHIFNGETLGVANILKVSLPFCKYSDSFPFYHFFQCILQNIYILELHIASNIGFAML